MWIVFNKSPKLHHAVDLQAAERMYVSAHAIWYTRKALEYADDSGLVGEGDNLLAVFDNNEEAREVFNGIFAAYAEGKPVYYVPH